MPSSKLGPKLVRSSASAPPWPGARDSARATTLSAIGSMIAVVAVLETNMLSRAEASMKPPITLVARDPARRRISSARRSANPQRCIASARRNPPINRKIKGLAYGPAAAPMSAIPVSGKSTSGSSAVAAISIASVNHQIAIQAITARVMRPAKLKSTTAPSATV